MNMDILKRLPTSVYIALSALILVTSFGCVRGRVLLDKSAALQKKLERVERPAMKCAPDRYASALAHIKFTEVEYRQGALIRAAEHMDQAETDAKIALGTAGRPQCEGDRDGDGIIDTLDACPDKPEDFDGNADRDGCPEDQDTDGDGILDSLDRCPKEREDFDGVEDADGCPDLTRDRDGDGFLDEVDNCPDSPEDKDGFEDEDGCPDPDNDRDRIPDTRDKCPDEPEDQDGDADDDGCPDIYKTIVVREDRIELKQKVFFTTGKAEIMERSFELLKEVAQALKSRQSVRVRIEGHTDSRGPDSYNLKLSGERAESVRGFLEQEGIAAARLEAKGFGEEQPIDTNLTEEGRASNRRVEFHIVRP